MGIDFVYWQPILKREQRIKYRYFKHNVPCKRKEGRVCGGATVLLEGITKTFTGKQALS